MTLTLLQKQQVFARMVGALILRAKYLGYDITFGEAYRTPEQAALNAKKGIGISNSLHTQRLAIDLNVFKNGVWLKDGGFDDLGTYWKSLDPSNRWGGDFQHLKDYNHFSYTNGGVS